MKPHIDHAQFVQDLVLRIASNQNFKGDDADIDRAFKTAFAVGRKFFDAYDAEVEEIKAIPDDKTKAEPKKANGGTKKPVAEKRAVKKASKA
jgi:hypothetical protein